jgi:hypothetical protein
MAAPFTHKPLDLAKDQIRLVKFLPSSDYAVRCTVHIFDRDQCPPYEALSYVWGSDIDTGTIEVNGRPHEVRENLWWFLEHATSCSNFDDRQDTHFNRFGYLWIDQLCIDQSSAGEKNQQVRMMSSIFQNAQRAIVWLGPEAHDSDRALAIIKAAAALFHGNPYELGELEKEEVHYFFEGNGLNNVRARQSLITLFQRPYWTRIWTVQEFLRAGDLLLMCGHSAIYWAELAVFYRLYRFFIDSMLALDCRYALLPSIFGPADRYIEHKFNAAWPHISEDTDFPRSGWQGYLYPPQWPLDAVLFNFSHLDCGDARDKIFGLLGIVQEQDRVTVDYSKPAHHIFRTVMSSLSGRADTYSNTRVFRRLGMRMGASRQELKNYEFFSGKELVYAGMKRKQSVDILMSQQKHAFGKKLREGYVL